MTIRDIKYRWLRRLVTCTVAPFLFVIASVVCIYTYLRGIVGFWYEIVIAVRDNWTFKESDEVE